MRLFVTVIPLARTERVERIDATHLRVAVTAPPHQGRANTAVIQAVAAFLNVSPSGVRILRGAAGRRKTIEVDTGD